MGLYFLKYLYSVLTLKLTLFSISQQNRKYFYLLRIKTGLKPVFDEILNLSVWRLKILLSLEPWAVTKNV